MSISKGKALHSLNEMFERYQVDSIFPFLSDNYSDAWWTTLPFYNRDKGLKKLIECYKRKGIKYVNVVTYDNGVGVSISFLENKHSIYKDFPRTVNTQTLKSFIIKHTKSYNIAKDALIRREVLR